MVRKLHNERPVNRGLEPPPVVIRGVVVTDPGLVSPHGHAQAVVEVIAKKQAFHIHFEMLCVGFFEVDFRENARPVTDDCGQKEGEISGVEICG